MRILKNSDTHFDPCRREEIAIVKASFDSGWTEKGSLDYAVDELRRWAANLNANAAETNGRDASSEVYSVPVYNSSPIIGSSSVEIVQVVTVWIQPEAGVMQCNRSN